MIKFAPRSTALIETAHPPISRQPHPAARATEPRPSARCPPAAAHTLRQNSLLAAMENDPRERLAEHLSWVPLTAGEVLYESGCRLKAAYFPTSAMISLSNVTADGKSNELALIGSEGLAGGSLLLGAESTPHRMVVQAAGYALRIPADALKFEFHRGGPLQHSVLRYTQSLLTQICQSAVCNRFHCVQEQFTRRLLSSLDRANSSEVYVTHENMAHALGVRRESVTAAAGSLQRAGVIDYHRGRIRVLDRGQLESLACECYHITRREFACRSVAAI